MNSKRFASALLVLAASGLVLAGCDDVEARPTKEFEDRPILNLENPVANNTMGEIYDALVTPGDTNSQNVLQNVLYLYSTTIYGNFFDVYDNEGKLLEKGLRTVAEEYLADNSKTEDITAFATAYPLYHDAEGKPAISKVINFYEEVLYRIRDVFWGYVQDSAYQVRSEFSEKKFYDAQTASYYDLAQPEGDVFPYNEGYRQVEGSFRLSEGATEQGAMKLDGGDRLHDGDIEDSYFKDIFGTYQNYIQDAVLPDIYRTELTAQYLIDQNIGQIRLTAARKIDMIALKDNPQYPTAVQNLVDAYAGNVIEAGLDMDVYGMTFLDTLYKGTVSALNEEATELAKKIYAAAGWNYRTITVNEIDYGYWLESSYGTIMEQYQTIADDRFHTESETVRDDFTGNGEYTIETGLIIKERTLRVQDDTTSGWFTSSSLTLDNEELKNRLFRVQVANEVDSTEWTASGYADDTRADNFQYGHYRGGNYYLTKRDPETGRAHPYVTYDETADTTYLIKVDEAVKSAKLTDGDNTVSSDPSSLYYDDMAKHANDPYYAEKVARKVAYSLASGDTWTSAANEYYVDQMALVYHDTEVYDYFVSTFPDLFD